MKKAQDAKGREVSLNNSLRPEVAQSRTSRGPAVPVFWMSLSACASQLSFLMSLPSSA